jgi:thioredoxin reductase (NADPH)
MVMAENDLRAAAFPTLTDAQIAELQRCTGAALQRFAAGQPLFRVGDRNFAFFVVKAGEVVGTGPVSR